MGAISSSSGLEPSPGITVSPTGLGVLSAAEGGSPDSELTYVVP